MEQAVVLGATGYVGSAVSKKLLGNNIPVVAIGRRSFEAARSVLPVDDKNLVYLQLDNKNLADLLNEKRIQGSARIVFYNFSWSGISRLTDGSLMDQLENVAYSSSAIKIAKQLGCAKYIHSGSQEETLFEKYLEKDEWKNKPYFQNSFPYAGSKLLTRDMNLFTAYLQKIDYIHTRFSVVLDPELSGTSYIAQTLKKIQQNEPYEPPKNQQLYEITDLDELAEAYVKIGFLGKNKSDYYIGLGHPQKLADYFEQFSSSKFPPQNGVTTPFHSLFDPAPLAKDTGFTIKKDFCNIAREIKIQ